MRTDMLRTTVLTAVLLTTGCTTNRFNTPIGTFRSDIQAGNAVIGDFYRTRNAYERKLYLLSVFVNKDSNNSPPPLIVTLTPLGYIAPRSKGTWYFPKVYGIIAKAVQCLSMCFNSLPYLHL